LPCAAAAREIVRGASLLHVLHARIVIVAHCFPFPPVEAPSDDVRPFSGGGPQWGGMRRHPRDPPAAILSEGQVLPTLRLDPSCPDFAAVSLSRRC
jgi:hypothetical protein